MSEPQTEAPETELAQGARALLNDIRDASKSIVGITDIGDLTKHLKDELWPTLEAIGEQLVANADDNEDLDNAVLELAEGEGEMLTAETAGVFANVFLQGEDIAAELEKRLGANDGALRIKIAAFKKLVSSAQDTLAELTVGDADDEGDEKEAE